MLNVKQILFQVLKQQLSGFSFNKISRSTPRSTHTSPLMSIRQPATTPNE